MTKKRTFSWTNPKVKIGSSKIHGKGVLATKNIKRGETVAVFGGHVILMSELKRLPKKIQDEGMQIDKKCVLGIKKMSELEDASYFNHSCDANAGCKGQISLVAMRDILKGEEVTFDYAMDLHDAKWYKLRCNCGSKNCRKIITDQDWKNPELQKRYKGFFQWYIQEKIDGLKKQK
jgi:SET domain-containing protein